MEEITYNLDKDVCDSPLVEVLFDLKKKSETYKYPKAVLGAIASYQVNKKYAVKQYNKRIDEYYKHRESHEKQALPIGSAEVA